MRFTPKFIYFDLDDTLLDHGYAERSALRDIHTHFELFEDTPFDKLHKVYKGVNSRQWQLYSRSEISRSELQRNRFEITLRTLDLDESEHAAVGRQYMRYYRNHWDWVEGAQQAFLAAAEHYEVGVLTNGFAETQRLKFEQFDLAGRARQLVISEEVGVLKPHPSIFAHATDLTGYRPDDILYIGDSYSSDVLGGTGYGWKVAWFTHSGSPEERDQADFIFSDFSRLTDRLEI